MAIDYRELKPGDWVVSNLVRHQNDYNLYRIGRIEERLVFYDIIIYISFSSGSPMKAKIRLRRDYSMPKGVFRNPQISKLKNAKRKYKRFIIESLFKEK